jgi:type II secretory pathway pseudopilin PulG
MAGSKLKHRVGASTIIEVVISMVIIVIVFGIAMTIFANVTRLSLSGKKLKAQALLRQAMITAEGTLNSTKTITIDEFRIEQEVKPYQQNSALSDIHLTAYDQNQQKIAELEKVIITQP